MEDDLYETVDVKMERKFPLEQQLKKLAEVRAKLVPQVLTVSTSQTVKKVSRWDYLIAAFRGHL